MALSWAFGSLLPCPAFYTGPSSRHIQPSSQYIQPSGTQTCARISTGASNLELVQLPHNRLLHYFVHPSDDRAVVIMWTSTRNDMTLGNWIPNRSYLMFPRRRKLLFHKQAAASAAATSLMTYHPLSSALANLSSSSMKATHIQDLWLMLRLVRLMLNVCTMLQRDEQLGFFFFFLAEVVSRFELV